MTAIRHETDFNQVPSSIPHPLISYCLARWAEPWGSRGDRCRAPSQSPPIPPPPPRGACRWTTDRSGTYAPLSSSSLDSHPHPSSGSRSASLRGSLVGWLVDWFLVDWFCGLSVCGSCGHCLTCTFDSMYSGSIFLWGLFMRKASILLFRIFLALLLVGWSLLHSIHIDRFGHLAIVPVFEMNLISSFDSSVFAPHDSFWCFMDEA